MEKLSQIRKKEIVKTTTKSVTGGSKRGRKALKTPDTIDVTGRTHFMVIARAKTTNSQKNKKKSTTSASSLTNGVKNYNNNHNRSNNNQNINNNQNNQNINNLGINNNNNDINDNTIIPNNLNKNLNNLNTNLCYTCENCERSENLVEVLKERISTLENLLSNISQTISSPAFSSQYNNNNYCYNNDYSEMNLESLIQLSANIHPGVNNNNIDAGNLSNVSPISTPTSTPIHTPPQQSFMVNSTNNNNNYTIFNNDIVVCNDNNGGDCNNRYEPLYSWSPDSINSSEFACDGCQL